jgi:hypothetical protein
MLTFTADDLGNFVYRGPVPGPRGAAVPARVPQNTAPLEYHVVEAIEPPRPENQADGATD